MDNIIELPKSFSQKDSLKRILCGIISFWENYSDTLDEASREFFFRNQNLYSKLFKDKPILTQLEDSDIILIKKERLIQDSLIQPRSIFKDDLQIVKESSLEDWNRSLTKLKPNIDKWNSSLLSIFKEHRSFGSLQREYSWECNYSISPNSENYYLYIFPGKLRVAQFLVENPDKTEYFPTNKRFTFTQQQIEEIIPVLNSSNPEIKYEAIKPQKRRVIRERIKAIPKQEYPLILLKLFVNVLFLVVLVLLVCFMVLWVISLPIESVYLYLIISGVITLALILVVILVIITYLI